MSGGVVLQAIVSGAAVGAVYGLIGLGFTLVHRLTQVLALAHGDLVVGSVFVGVLAVIGSTPVAARLGAVSSAALVAVALLAGAVLSAATYLLTVRPFLPRVGAGRGGDYLGWVAGGVAAGLLVRTLLGLALPAQAYAVPDALHLGSRLLRLPGGGVVPVRTLGVIAVGLVTGGLVERYVVATRLGRALRAVADDVDAATLIGVPVARVVLVAFVLAGLLAGLAGVLDAPGRALSVDAGVVLGLKGVAAALLGRLGSLRGALVGGVVLGVLEQLAVASPWLGAGWVDVGPLAVLVVLLALRPEGLRAPARVRPE